MADEQPTNHNASKTSKRTLKKRTKARDSLSGFELPDSANTSRRPATSKPSKDPPSPANLNSEAPPHRTYSYQAENASSDYVLITEHLPDGSVKERVYGPFGGYTEMPRRSDGSIIRKSGHGPRVLGDKQEDEDGERGGHSEDENDRVEDESDDPLLELDSEGDEEQNDDEVHEAVPEEVKDGGDGGKFSITLGREGISSSEVLSSPPPSPKTPLVDPAHPLQRIDPRLPRQPQPSQHQLDEQTLLGLYLSVCSGNPATHARDSVQRALATITNFRTLMSEISSSGICYCERAKSALRYGEWGVFISDALEVLRDRNVKVEKWKGGKFEGWLGLEGRVRVNSRDVVSGE